MISQTMAGLMGPSQGVLPMRYPHHGSCRNFVLVGPGHAASTLAVTSSLGLSLVVPARTQLGALARGGVAEGTMTMMLTMLKRAREKDRHVREGGWRDGSLDGTFLGARQDGYEGITVPNIAKAIATFERTVVSGIALFDEWIAGDEKAISASAKRSFDLFNNKANCVACHSGWNFTDDSFHDIRLESTDIGRGKQVSNVKPMQHAF